VNALSHPFWVKKSDEITINNNHIETIRMMLDDPGFRWCCDEIVASRPFGRTNQAGQYRPFFP